jgi:hypothetical protein
VTVITEPDEEGQPKIVRWGGAEQHVPKQMTDGSLKTHQMSEAEAMRYRVRARAKRKAMENIDQRPFKVLCQSLMEVNTGPDEHLIESDLNLVSAV